MSLPKDVAVGPGKIRRSDGNVYGRYDGPGSFSAKIQSFKEISMERAQRAVEIYLKRACEAMVRDSPVLTGNFRYQWQFTMDQKPTSTLIYPGYTGPGNEIGGENDFIVPAEVTLSRLEKDRIQFELGRTVYIYNLADYSIPLEYGFSKKAPEGMVRVFLGRSQFVLDAAIEQAKQEIE